MFEKLYLNDTEKQDFIAKKIWDETCPVDINRLMKVKLSYIDFAGEIHNDGEMLVLDIVADSVINIFRKLYLGKFPIAKIKQISHYKCDDNLSMQDNNSSAFNLRYIANSNTLSIHSYGLAIDINPVQNPYILEMGNKAEILPIEGAKFLNRTILRPGMVENKIDKDNNVVDIFRQYGFKIWGGNWEHPDWHHFQLERTDAINLTGLSFADGKRYFENLIQS